jgi:hypothetical protein
MVFSPAFGLVKGLLRLFAGARIGEKRECNSLETTATTAVTALSLRVLFSPFITLEQDGQIKKGGKCCAFWLIALWPFSE